jgi:hypothetical protein
MVTQNPLFKSYLGKLCLLFVVVLCLIGGQVVIADTAIDNTQPLNQQQQLEAEKKAFKGYLAQDEVKDKLLAWGADPERLRRRVDHMTLAELQQLNIQIRELPAGGFIGAFLWIFTSLNL